MKKNYVHPSGLFRFLSLVLFIFVVTGLTAQTGIIKGRVTGLTKDNAPIVNLLAAKDSSIVKASIAEPDGSFEFDHLKEGIYLVNTTLLGYQPQLSAPVEINASKWEMQLPVITLQQSSTALQEVEVVSQKLFVQRKIDRVVVNPDALISNAGKNALEVLEKAPGVRIDMDGNISLKGKAGVIVFIDDKPTYISSADLANYLRSLPSGSIESMEIMTNPPAKYEAAGNAGIINIKLKKDIAKGFNGGVTVGYGQGRYMRTNNNFNFNYSVDKINLFCNAGWNQNGFFQKLNINRYYYTAGGDYSSAFIQNSYIKATGGGPNARMGMDYYISKRSTVGTVLSGFINPSLVTLSSNSEILNASNQPVSLVSALSTSDKTWKNGSINLNYVYKLDEKNRQLTTNADYIAYRSEQDQLLTNRMFTPDHVPVSESVLQSQLPADIVIQSVKVDYEHPMEKAGRIDAGVKTSIVHTDNTAAFYDVINEVAKPNYEFSNRFQYKENIYAGYLNYSKDWQKFSMQLGVRLESTDIHGHQLGNIMVNDSSFHVNYLSGFPTLYLSYKVDSAQKNQFGFSFGRRINRPDYQDMNPFTYPFDRFTYYGGNPFLKPTFSYNFEASHTYNNMLTTTLEYSLTNNLIQETNEQRGTIYYSRPGNYGKQVVYGISVNGNFKLNKWWSLQVYTEAKNVAVKSIMYGQPLDAQCWYWYARPTNQFTITKKLSMELGGMYLSKVLSGQLLMIPVWEMEVGAAYKILGDKGTLKLNLSDMLYTRRGGGDIRNIANSTSDWYSTFDSRVIYLSFSYRFNKGKILQARQTGASDTEKNRVKTN